MHKAREMMEGEVLIKINEHRKASGEGWAVAAWSESESEA